MKRIFTVLISILLLIVIPSVYAQVDTYNDYIGKLNTFRNDYSKFITSRNSYKTFQTLTSETEAIQSTKTMLVSRTSLLITYLEYLKKSLEKSTFIPKERKEAYSSSMSQIQLQYASKKQEISQMTTIVDLQKINDDYMQSYPTLATVAAKSESHLLSDELYRIWSTNANILASLKQYVSANDSKITQQQRQTATQWINKIENSSNIIKADLDQTSNAIESLTIDVRQILNDKQQKIQKSQEKSKSDLYLEISTLSELTSYLENSL